MNDLEKSLAIAELAAKPPPRHHPTPQIEPEPEPDTQPRNSLTNKPITFTSTATWTCPITGAKHKIGER